MRFLLLLLIVVSFTSAAESVFSDTTSGFSLKIPFEAGQKVGKGVESDALTMVSYGGYFEGEILSLVIMVLKKGNAGVDLNEYVASVKTGFKDETGMSDLTDVPQKFGQGFVVMPEGEKDGKLMYVNKVNDCIVMLTVQSRQKTLLEFRKWIEANNR